MTTAMMAMSINSEKEKHAKKERPPCRIQGKSALVRTREHRELLGLQGIVSTKPAQLRRITQGLNSERRYLQGATSTSRLTHDVKTVEYVRLQYYCADV